MSDPLIGRVIGNYKIEEQLGGGGMGSVYKAVHTEIGSVVAIKVLGLGRSASEKDRARFLNEARALAKLQHSNIIRVSDFVYQDGIYYTLMEYVEGESLRELMDKNKAPLFLAKTARILAQVGRALDYAHNRGVVHRDIKPSNILISEDGRVILSDFGIAKLAEATTVDLTRDGSTVGTPAYMSPEQAKAQDVDIRTDIYSLGIVLFEMVTGRVPFSGASHMEVISSHVNQAPPEPRSLNPNLTGRQEGILQKALKKDPKERFQRAGDLTDAFLSTITGTLEVGLETGSKLERFREGRTWGVILRIGRGFQALSLGILGIISRSIISVVLGAVIVVVALLIGASLLLGNVLESAIGEGDWGFDQVGIGHRQEFAPEDFVRGLEMGIRQIMPGTVTDLWVMPRSSGIVFLNGTVQGIPVTIEASVVLEGGNPSFSLHNLNKYPLPIVGGLVARGINRGFETALSNANATIESIEMDTDRIVIVIDGPAITTTLVDPNQCLEGDSLSDDFSDIYSGWTQSYETDQAGVGYKGGAYSLWTSVSNIIVSQALPCRFTEFAASIEAVVQGEAADASWGFVFYETDPENYWVLQINSLGWYSLEKVSSGNYNFVIEWTETDVIHKEGNNLFRVVIGESGEVWINGRRLESFNVPQEDRPLSGGSFGMLVRSGEQANVEVSFDNLIAVGSD